MAAAFLQSKSTSTDSSLNTATAIILTNNIVVGNKVVGYCFWNNSSDDLTQVKDNLGNANATIVDTVSNGDIQKSFWFDVSVGGACTITLTTSTAHGFRGMVAHEVSGLNAGAPDQHKLIDLAAPGTGTDAITTSPNVTTTADGEYIFGAVHVNNVLVMTVTQGTNFTDRESIDGTAAVSPLESEDLIQSTQGGISVTFTENSSQQCAPCIMTFKASAGTADTSTPYLNMMF